MDASTPLLPLWLSYQERIELVRLIANCLESDTNLSPEHRDLLCSVQSELSVAAARDGGTKISFAKLRRALGEDDSSVPVKLATEERQTLIGCLDLPIALKHKLAA